MFDSPKKIHCLGAGGIGLSGVAALLSGAGHKVSGCDEKFGEAIRAWLESTGVKTYCGHSAEHIDIERPDLIIRSPAVSDECDEILMAGEAGIPIYCRGEVLAEISKKLCTIAVCGTHGKTTTSSFTAMILQGLGFAGTGWCIGGYTERMGAVAKSPDGGSPFVIEADESDGTLALYEPQITVVTSIDPDHMEHFASFEALKDCFRKALDSTKRKVIFCADNETARETASVYDGAIGYGLCEDASVRALNPRYDGEGTTFTFVCNGKSYGETRLSVPGKHNLLNALGATAVALTLGAEPEAVKDAIGVLGELPHRRFEITDLPGGTKVVSDYSHHPVEIKALTDTALLTNPKRLRIIFQPHRYTRTLALRDEFVRAFNGADELLLLPVYAASEKTIAGGTTADLYAAFRKAGEGDKTIPVPKLAGTIDEAAAYYNSSQGVLREGDLLLCVGAGDVVSLIGKLNGGNRQNRASDNEASQSVKVSDGVPIDADSYMEVADEETLKRELAARVGKTPKILGQGTNLLPSPLGVRGKVIRLVNRDVRISDNGIVEAGAGVSGALLLSKLRDAGLGGLEFMAGIPGTLGGWITMNAGTRDGAVGDRVESCVLYTEGGERVEMRRGDFNFAYRSAPFAKDKIVFSVTLCLTPDSPENIADRMKVFSQKRFDFTGLKTAGSVFKNPDGTTAGKLLDECGLKGLRIGGAQICDRHANIISTNQDAVPSDVMALMAVMEEKVRERFGIKLEQEVREW